jgi:hypothetical protein
MAACSVCGDPKTVAKGRCGCCYQFFRRHGRDRGHELVVKLTERDVERELERALERRRRAARGWSPDV